MYLCITVLDTVGVGYCPQKLSGSGCTDGRQLLSINRLQNTVCSLLPILMGMAKCALNRKGRVHMKSSVFNRTGEIPPSGMIEGLVETEASVQFRLKRWALQVYQEMHQHDAHCATSLVYAAGSRH